MAGGVEIVIVFDKIPGVGARLRREASTRLDQQGQVTKNDIQSNITAMGLIESGAMLESTDSRKTGPFDLEVGPTAVSDDGYPYPAAQNYGTVHVPATGFASLSAEKARTEYPRRFSNIGEALV